MRSLVVVAALAAQFVFAAEAPFAFTLAWEQGEHSLTNEHARGAKAEILDPDPSDVKASARPAAKTWAAMHALYSKLLMLFPLR